MAEVLTLPQAARRFRVTLTWLKRQAEAGTLPHLKAGSRFLFNPAALADALARMAAEYPRQQQGVANVS
ncbi:MAG: hypothetical protein JWO38_6132 [Gemmataceae bacterium]|nr:hypothetical protein [Gemmataceae bacterium]